VSSKLTKPKCAYLLLALGCFSFLLRGGFLESNSDVVSIVLADRKVCKNLAHNFGERELDGFINNDNVGVLGGRVGLGSFGLSFLVADLLIAKLARFVL
jgi:hypothetical protein